MAGKLFIGFDINKNSNTLLPFLGTAWFAADYWPNISFPRGVYHNLGIPTQSYALYGPNGGGTFQNVTTCYQGGLNGSVGTSCGDSSTIGWITGQTPPRSQFQASQGNQIGIIRSLADLGTTPELFFTFDILVSAFGSTDRTTGWTPTDSWNCIFVWGDVSVRMKGNSGSSSTVGTIILSIRNGAAEVSTLTLASFTRNDHLHCKLRVKLDDTTGAIEMTVQGQTQSTPYTNQNTVATTSLASATVIYIGPPVLDNGSTHIICGSIDNIYVDDAAFPTGRPVVTSFALASDSSTSNMAAFGTGATTVTDALSNPADAKAMRATASGGYAILNQTPPTTTSYLSDVVGIEMCAQGAANRNPSADRRLEMGYELGGIQTMGIKSKNQALIFDSSVAPPTAAGQRSNPVEQIFETQANNKMTTTELATMKVVLKSASP